MPAQAAFSIFGPSATQVPGATNLDADELDWHDIIAVANGGSVAAQATLAALYTFFSSPVAVPYLAVTSGSTVTLDGTISVVLVNKTVNSATSIILPAVADTVDGMDLTIKQGALLVAPGTAITVHAPAGINIDDSPTLVIPAQLQAVHLKFMSGQWWTM